MHNAAASRLMKHTALRSFAFVPCLAAAAFATDDVDLEVRGNEKVQGTLRPADERESFLLDLPQFATVTATVKRKSGPVPTLELLDGGDATVASGVATPTGAKLSKFAVPAS